MPWPAAPRSRAPALAFALVGAGAVWAALAGGICWTLAGPGAAIVVVVVGLLGISAITLYLFQRREVARLEARCAELADDGDRFRSFFDDARGLLFECDPGGRFRIVNQAGIALLGLDPVHERLSLFSVVAPEDAVHVSEIADHATPGDDERSFILDLLTSDGSRVPVEVITRVVRDRDGVVRCIRGAGRVLPFQRDEDGDVRGRATRFKTLIDNLPEGIALLDRNDTVLVTNPPGEALISEYGTYLAGQRLVLFGGVPIERLTGQGGARLLQEVVVQEPYHQVLEVTGQQLVEGDETAGAVLVIRDVTADRQRRERLERNDRLAAVGQLAAGIAHDFKNILQGINLCADLSRSPKLARPQLTDNMLTIIEQAERGSKLIQQIMDFTRQSESTQRLLDLRELLTKTIDLLSKGLPPEVELELAIGDGEFPVMVDPGQIQQVVANLVLNARDAMPNGGHLTVTLSEVGTPGDRGPRPPEVRDGDWLRIAVADTGTGIPRSVQHRVFEPFFTTKRAGTGTGLGLAQVYGNVQQHGGHVDFETTAGAGTTFHVFLRPYRYHRPAETSDRDGTACPRGLGETVLVVEDELAVLNATSQSLRTLGYRVLEAVDGSDALRLFEEAERVDLVVSDVRMPGMDGRALAAELKRRDPNVKVLLMTAYATWPEGSEHPPAGVEGVLTKPFSLDSLGAAVHRILLS